MAKDTNRLFPEFPEVTTGQWEEQIIKDLKGKDYQRALIWQSPDGIAVNPYYREENLAGKEYLDIAPGVFPFVRGNNPENNWLIRQDIVVTGLQEANRKALNVLGKGVTSLGFIFEECRSLTKDDLEILLREICLEAAEVNLVCGCPCNDLLKAFTELTAEGPWNKQNISGSVAFDPLTRWLLTGKSEVCCEEKHFHKLRDNMLMAESLPQLRTVAVYGKIFGNSGASVIQELAFSLSLGAEYMTQLTGLALQPGEVAERILFNLSIGKNYFFEIAKLRAGRLLWSQIVKAFGPECDDSARMIVHAETGTFNKTVYDPYVNLLRTQTEAMSAALGGAHSVSILPFDHFFRQTGEFSERLARNQQVLLKEEAYLDKITDVAGGAYYLESLTEAIAEQAWQLFLEVDDRGGFLAAMKEGFIQKTIRETAARRIQNIASRRDNLLGVNQFPNFSEVLSAFPGQPVSQLVAQPVNQDNQGTIETLTPFRVGQALEALRFRTDSFSGEHKRPSAFMLTIGDPAMRKARAQFICNFFASGGFEVTDNNGFNTVGEGLSAARLTGAEIVVVCSSDEEYATLVPELAGLMDKEILVVAGNPACRPELEAIGVKNYIHVKSNLVEELTKYQKLLKIAD